MAIAKNTTILTHVMVVLIHFTSLAKFIHKSPKQRFISEEPGIIHCSAVGNPSPQFKWSRQDGQSLQDGRFIQLANGSLKVKPILREDDGSYICTIRQSRGSDSISEKSQLIIVSVIGKMRQNTFTSTCLSIDQKNHQSMAAFGEGCNCKCIIKL